MKMRSIFILLILLGDAHAAPDILVHEVAAPRLKLANLVTLTRGVADTDLGPAPAPGASRIFTREEIASLLPPQERARASAAVRVVRKTQDLAPHDVEKLVRQSIVDHPLANGVSLEGVRAVAVTVAAGWTKAALTIPTLPARAGLATAIGVLELTQDGVSVGHIDVPLVLKLTAEAATPLVVHGASVSLLVQRGLVRVSAAAVVNTDGGVGDIVNVTVRSTSRVMRARVVDAKNVVAVGDP